MSGPSRRMLITAGAVFAIGAAGLAWRHCGGEHTADDLPPLLLDEPAVPAPDQLLADLVVGAPNASWGRLQRGIGGALGILPQSAGGIICLGAGLDPLLASEIDGTAPAYGVLAGDPADPRWVFAVKLADLRKARASLVDGETARFASREIGGVTELLAKGGGNHALPVVLAITTNSYLLLAHAEGDLALLAPYATRALPKRALPTTGAVTIQVPRAALGTLVKPKLEELWGGLKGTLLAADERMRQNHGGRAPDYGDPKAIVAAVDGWVEKRIAVVSDLETMAITVDLSDDGVSITSTMTPLANGGPAATWTDAMVLGDSAPIAALPVTSAIAVLVRDNEADRAAQAAGVESLVTSALGPRLAEADAKKLHAVVADYEKARADLVTAGLFWDEPQGLFLRGPVRDADAAARTVAGALDLARIAPFKELLRAKDVSMRTEDAVGLGKIAVATITREPRADKPRNEPPRADQDAGATRSSANKKDELGLAWLTEAGKAGGPSTFALASGELPAATLAAAVHPERTLGDELLTTRSLTALGADTNSVLVAQPLRFDPMRANLPVAPLVVALGRKDRKAVLRIDVANGLLRELTRMLIGL